MKFSFLLFTFLFFISLEINAQTYDNNVLKQNRTKMYQNLVSRSINDNLGKPLNANSEAGWETALETMIFLRYHSPFADAKIADAVKQFPSSSVEMNKKLLTYLYAFKNYNYTKDIAELLPSISDDYLFALAENYVCYTDTAKIYKNALINAAGQKQALTSDGKILDLMAFDLFIPPIELPDISPFFDPNYLKGQVLVLSFQRKDRDYPGLVIVRDSVGNFLKESDGKFVALPQLARSLSNLPYYFFNGNTPQGIFRMMGFDTSKANFIGRTTNVQLKMPYETKPALFYNDKNNIDTTWNADLYQKLLPESFKNYLPLYQTTAAGILGRTEIISHGTTVNPDYYKGSLYYPLTPTQGCLTTKEIWNEENGRLENSDQQRLTELIKKAGGANGYYIVLELNDTKGPVTLADIEPAISQDKFKN